MQRKSKQPRGVDVGLGVDRLVAAGLLRRHVAERADHRAALRDLANRAFEAGDAEVEEA